MKTTIDLICVGEEFRMACIAPHVSTFQLEGSRYRINHSVNVKLPLLTQSNAEFAAAIKAGKKVRVTFEVLP